MTGPSGVSRSRFAVIDAVKASRHGQTAPSVIANNWKTVTSRLLRKEFAQHIRTFYWSKPVLWSRSYCVLSVGGAPLSVLKRYIEQQERPD